MARWLIFLFGLFAYMVAVAASVSFALFVADSPVGPSRIDGAEPRRVDVALLVNLGLIVLFAAQHSLMARTNFKRRWTKIIPPAAERSFYVLCSGLVLIAICYGWQTLPGVLWNFGNAAVRYLLIGLQLAGWFLAAVATLTINHGELFGLEQVYVQLRGKKSQPPQFTERGVYLWVRHPLQSGILIALWSTPTMTTTHLVLAATLTAYIFLGLYWEERDLEKSLGPAYADYRRRVPMLLPRGRRRG